MRVVISALNLMVLSGLSLSLAKWLELLGVLFAAGVVPITNLLPAPSDPDPNPDLPPPGGPDPAE